MARGSRVVSLSRNLPPADERAAGVEYYKCDVSEVASVRAAMANINAAFGYIDILVVNAGIMPGAFLLRHTRASTTCHSNSC